MQPPRPSKHRANQHASTHVPWGVYQLSCPTLKSHSTSASFRRWLDLALNWLFEGIYLKKHYRSAVDLARQDARRAKDGCVLQKKSVSYLIPTLILSFHTIEYFVPFLGTNYFITFWTINHTTMLSWILAEMGVWPILTNAVVNTFSTDLNVSIDMHVTTISLQQGQLKRLSKTKISSLFSSLFRAGVRLGTEIGVWCEGSEYLV